MKLPIICAECSRGFSEAFSSGFWKAVTIEDIRDDGIYTVQCVNGHTTKTILQEQKFEILFQIGAYAIADGYYREAISSFTSSLEQLYAFFIRAALSEKGVSDEATGRMWHYMKNQSERQLGAFIVIYTSELGKAPVLLDEKLISCRNKVIHQGLIPDRNKAVEYGEAVRSVMHPIMKEVNNRYPIGVQKLISQHLSRGYNQNAGVLTSTLSIKMIISLLHGSVSEDIPLDAAIHALPKYQDKR